MGIKNTGRDISRYFQIYDLLLSYLNGEIDENTYKNILDVYFGIEVFPFELNCQYNSEGQKFAEEAYEKLMTTDNIIADEILYSNICRIIKRSNLELPIYDVFGNVISSLESQKQKVKMLKQKSHNYFQK